MTDEQGLRSGDGQVTVTYTTAVTPTSLCDLTLQYADGSAKYLTLNAKQKAAFDKTISKCLRG